MPRTRFARCCITLVLAGLLNCAQAAELGDPLVRTYIGQPLVADIELTMLADPSVPVAVRIAHADVYRGANIAMHPVLAHLAMSVMRRDGRQFLHITSVRVVESDYVHLFLELNEGGKRTVRAVTLWLSPDPAPPPPPTPPAPARLTADQELEAAAARAAMAAPKPSLLARARRDAAPAACPPQVSEEQLKTCAAIDYKNGLLSAQIVELEEKVKLLQLSIEGKKALPPAAATPARKAVPVPPPQAPRPAPAKVKAGFPWLLAGSGVAGLLGVAAGVFFYLRRRKAKSAEAAASDSAAWYARLAARFKRKPKEAAAEPPVEPTAE